MTMACNQLKILAVAYACNPYRGSEHGVGWGWVKMISELHEVHVISAEFERKDIEHWLGKHPEYKKRIHFFYPQSQIRHHHIRSKLWLKIEQSPLKIIMNMAYRFWQKDAFQLARKLHEKFQFDICHLITFVGYRFPGKFYQLSCPFVWGPIGGLENTPLHLIRNMGSYGAVYYAVWNLINNFDRHLLPGPKKAMHKAAQTGGVIAATSAIKREIKRFFSIDSHIICETGPPEININNIALNREEGQCLIICWSGEHSPRKALPLLFYALKQLPKDIEWHLDILGAGPCTAKWIKQAQKLGIRSRCNFYGKLSRASALVIMQQSHLFVITSLKDLTSTVLIEALMMGKPIIAPDHCGFSDVITEECGFKLPIKNIKNFVILLSKKIQQLYHDETLRRQLSIGAFKRINEFEWNKKMQALNHVYQKAISPSFNKDCMTDYAE